MKLDARVLVPPLLAAVILALILTQTRDALTLSGAWHRASVTASHAPSPFAPIEDRLAAAPAPPAALPRDPFRNAPAPQLANAGSRRPARPRPPAPPPLPVLTSIVFDADPRATVRWNGREYSVRAGTLFADFQVTRITKDQVVLDRGGESVVLRLPQRGENP